MKYGIALLLLLAACGPPPHPDRDRERFENPAQREEAKLQVLVQSGTESNYGASLVLDREGDLEITFPNFQASVSLMLANRPVVYKKRSTSLSAAQLDQLKRLLEAIPVESLEEKNPPPAPPKTDGFGPEQDPPSKLRLSEVRGSGPIRTYVIYRWAERREGQIWQAEKSSPRKEICAAIDFLLEIARPKVSD